MNGIYQNYQIDLSSNNNFVQYNTIQGDGNGVRGFKVELTEHNKPYIISNDVEVFIAGTKPDTKQIFNSCELTKDGKILIDVTSQMSAVAGRSDYQIILISKTTNQQLKSFPFIIYVKEAAFDAADITSSDEFNALNGMVNKIESTLNKTDLVDSMLESSSKILDDTTTAYDNAVKSLEKAQDAIETAESINSTAQESADNAKQSEENSLLYSNLSKSYAVGTNDEIRENDSTDNAKYYKEQAELNSASALQSANLAVQKADDASLSETNVQQYALNAASSEANAKISEENAKNSEENALNSETNALQSATDSENSANAALESATNAGLSEAAAKDYSEKAAKSAEKAENIVGITIATPEKAGIVKPDGTTITIDADGTLHGANTVEVDGETIEKTQDNVLKVSDSVLYRLDGLSNRNDKLEEYVSERIDGIWDQFGTVDNSIERLEYATETEFDEETERKNIVSGEKLSDILGKIKKWFSDLKTVAFTGNYDDLSNKPTIPSVGNGTVTIMQNGDNKGSFSMNQSGNATITLSDTNTDTNTWRPVQDNLSSYSTTDSLSANMGRELANGSARDNTKMPVSGGTFTGQVSFYLSGNEGGEIHFTSDVDANKYIIDVADSCLRIFRESVVHGPFMINGNNGHFGSGWTFDGTVSQIKVVNVKYAMTDVGEFETTINYREHGFNQCPSWNLYGSNLSNEYFYTCYADGNIIKIKTRRSSGYGNPTDSFFIHMVGI